MMNIFTRAMTATGVFICLVGGIILAGLFLDFLINIAISVSPWMVVGMAAALWLFIYFTADTFLFESRIDGEINHDSGERNENKSNNFNHNNNQEWNKKETVTL